MATPLHRAELLDDRSLTGRAFCDAYCGVMDDWLRALWADAVAVTSDGGAGMALVAVGGQGRRELCPQSDLDLLLLSAKGVDAAHVADGMWYPIWDEGLKLGHAVRSLRDTLALAADVVVAGRGSFLQVSEIAMGVAAPMCQAWLHLRHSPALGDRITLLGDRIPAAELLRMGVVAEVVDDEQVVERAEQLADRIAGHPAAGRTAVARVWDRLRGRLDDPDAWFVALAAGARP